MYLIVISLLLLTISLLIYAYKRNSNASSSSHLMPPFVNGKRYFGNYYDLNINSLHLSISNIGKSYDNHDLYTISVFGKNYVILNSKKAINDLFISYNNECSGRPQSLLLRIATNNYKDIAFTNSNELWSNNRKLIHHCLSLRTINNDRYTYENVFDFNWIHLYQTIDKQSNNGHSSIDLKPLLYNTQMRIMCELLFGRQVLANNVEIMDKVKILDKYGKLVISSLYEIMLNMKPFSFLYVFNGAFVNLVRALLVQRDIMRTIFSKSSTNEAINGSKNANKSFLEYIKTFLIDKCGDETLGKNILTELLFAGHETIVNTVYAFLLYLSKYQNIQNKAYKELCEAGVYDLVNLRDKRNLPYLNACIFETLRLISHIPLGIFRRLESDVKIYGYHIPKDTVLIPNIWKIHHDESVFNDAYTFVPERFLNNNGELLNADNELFMSFMPFGMGKRSCPGKQTAINLIFLYVSNIICNFELTLATTNTSDDPRTFQLNSNLEPNEYKVAIKKRIINSETLSSRN